MTAVDDPRRLAYIAGQASDARVNLEIETEGMTLNIGPQHPATHGTLRIPVKWDGQPVTIMREEDTVANDNGRIEYLSNPQAELWVIR